MRLLLVLDRVENAASANALLGRRLGEALHALGHEVHLLELWDGETPPSAVPVGLVLHTEAFLDELRMNRALENGVRGGSPVPLRLLRLARHPDAVSAAFRQLVLHAPRRTVQTRRRIEALHAATPFDVVCAVCAPYRSAFALETARIDAKKVLWQLDPYASNREYTAPGGYAREGQLLDAMTAAFITPQAEGDYAPGAPLAAWQRKVHVLGFPALLPAQSAPQPHSGVQCVFCGSLHPGLRPPDAALALFCALNDPDLTLTMAGPGWQHFAAPAAEAEAVLGERFCRPGPLSPAEARTLLEQADILLNLGNREDNQMPSKLFEYFGTGLPVLHLCQSPTDPTLPYLAQYPLALVLDANALDDAAVQTLRLWLVQVRGQRLPFAEVAALFAGFTPQQVAQDFLQALGA